MKSLDQTSLFKIFIPTIILYHIICKIATDAENNFDKYFYNAAKGAATRRSNVETEKNDVAVVHNVLLALQSDKSLFFCGSH